MEFWIAVSWLFLVDVVIRMIHTAPPEGANHNE